MRNRVAVSDRMDGGYGSISELITPNTTEAAQVLQLTGQQKWYLYYDYWAEGKYAVMESTDMVNWSKELKQDDIRFPYQRRHASFFPVSEEELFKLINHFSLLARYRMDDSCGKLLKEGAANEDFLQESYSLRTVSFWMKAEQTDGTQVLYDEGSDTTGLAIQFAKGRLQAATADGGKNAVVSAKIKDPGIWHHVAAVFSEGSLKLYVDGKLNDTVKTGFQKVDAHLGEGGFGRRFDKDAFGGSGEGADFRGVLSEAAIYNTPLQDADVAYLYKEEVKKMR
ncbi:LamG-like jellyroll fold domain-containing protein [Paenibacillus sp. Soil766]|uniref:LamG-like jellyroll fold domain-containing protein n=1 Tax=Paenibacillus sp. Soil766 TaxID=1736404 RepID=UPI0009E80EB6|nr:LamG-like jellyroll fold domain-containing protein [Paenibacillus sp. Soil766]